MSRKTLILLLVILGTAVFLRLFRLTQHDVINDEVFYGYRSIGLIDSLNSPFQPTPHEWYDPIPSWAKLSFHDHPPLGFWLMHASFQVFGNNLWGLRLPSVLAGVLSVFLGFLIARKLFNENIGLLAAGILAINNYHIWISRIALQESLVIFFMLLVIWLFLKTILPLPHPLHQGEEIKKLFLPPGGGGWVGGSNDLYFYLTVIATGLAILTKYTAVILIPIFLIFLLWQRRDLLTWPRILVSTGLLVIILSPVIIYNLKLYASRGHFDFQISYFLGQDTPEWQVRPGRDVGGITDKIQNFFVRFWQGYGIAFSILTMVALVLNFIPPPRWGRLGGGEKHSSHPSPVLPIKGRESNEFLILNILFLILLILVVGPQERFLAMLAPTLAILIAAVTVILPRPGKTILVSLLAAELVFAVNSNLTTSPYGRETLHYSILRRDSNLWGYNQLEQYLQNKMQGRYAPLQFPFKFSFANALSSEAIKKAKAEGGEPHQILFVTDSAISGFASLWYFTRHSVYDGWPVLSEKSYLEATRSDPQFFTKQGFSETVFIKAEDTLLQSESHDIPAELIKDINPTAIPNPRGGTAFLIYEKK